MMKKVLHLYNSMFMTIIIIRVTFFINYTLLQNEKYWVFDK